MGIGLLVQRSLLISLAFFAGVGAAAAADLVVIKSNVAALAKGAVIDDAKPISIAAGQSVSLVSAAGAVITINGPFDGAPSQRAGGGGGGDGRLVASLATLLQGHGADQSQLGATRNLPGEEPDDPLQINTSKSADFCAPEGATLKLWRPDNRKSLVGRARLKSLETGGMQKEFTWAVDETEVPWPAGVPLKSGAAYLISSSDMPTPARVIVHIIPASVAPGAAQAAWMAENGCQDQALLALATVR